MGGGFPVAAFGGRADVMAHLAPAGPVYQAGTLSGNPVATAAGLATLQLCTPEVYAAVDRSAALLRDAASAALTEAGVGHRVGRAGSMFSLFLTEDGTGPDGTVKDYDEARTQDVPAFAAFFHAMLARGVHLPPSTFESWFLSASHDEEALGIVLDALPHAARAAAGAQAAPRI
jgi:glutamate-1-semialdehyde 2,1-aminomutase